MVRCFVTSAVMTNYHTGPQWNPWTHVNLHMTVSDSARLHTTASEYVLTANYSIGDDVVGTHVHPWWLLGIKLHKSKIQTKLLITRSTAPIKLGSTNVMKRSYQTIYKEHTVLVTIKWKRTQFSPHDSTVLKSWWQVRNFENVNNKTYFPSTALPVPCVLTASFGNPAEFSPWRQSPDQ